jgi:purine catabolism regulator
MRVPISVEELVDIPSLRTWVLAGEGGLQRSIGWAHVCELPEPWEWLGDGDLVMTTGLGIPADASEQVRYVSRLSEAGVVGVAIGESMSSPPLTGRMLAAANRIRLPLLATRYDVRFADMARAVAAANLNEEDVRLVRSLRIFERLQLLVEGTAESGLIKQLGQDVHCKLFLLDARTGEPIDSEPDAFADAAAEGLRKLGRTTTSRRPAVVRLDGAKGALVLPVTASRPLLLVAVPWDGVRPDLTLLHHVTTVLAVEQASTVAARERTRRLGASLFSQLLDGRLENAVAAEQLAEAGLRSPLVLTASIGDPHDVGWTELHHGLDDVGLSHLLATRGEITWALLPADAPALTALLRGLPTRAYTGVSDAFDPVGGLGEAQRRARWACFQAQATDTRVAHYGVEASASPFLPPSLEQSRELALRVLGPLLEYDEQHGQTLLPTLTVFLEENRSWQRAAARLHVHRQTLVYRINRISQLSGRRLDSTAHVSELWLALQAGTASGVIPP